MVRGCFFRSGPADPEEECGWGLPAPENVGGCPRNPPTLVTDCHREVVSVLETSLDVERALEAGTSVMINCDLGELPFARLAGVNACRLSAVDGRLADRVSVPSFRDSVQETGSLASCRRVTSS